MRSLVRVVHLGSLGVDHRDARIHAKAKAKPADGYGPSGR